jgi:hypothetical protein
MSLKITSNQILIQNSAGVTKFSSSDKLLYLKGYQSGSVTMNANDVNTWFATPIGSPSDIILMKIEFTSSNGNLVSSFLGYEMMVAGSIALNTDPGSHAASRDAEQTILNIAIIRGAVIFRKYKVNGIHRIQYDPTYFTLNYKWFQYSAL